MSTEDLENLKQLQQSLGHQFTELALLRQALTHRSHGQPNNERLEFLGDSVLNCAMAALLYDSFGKIDEGDLSRLRANLVKQQSLVDVAHRLEVAKVLLLGEGEQKSGGFKRPSILGDTMEALFGAVFLDAGFDAARRVIAKLYQPILKTIDPNTLGKDAKTLLQEHLQSRRIPLPVYSVVATHGAAHNQVFEVECAIPKLNVTVLGTGGSRRAAEQAAAKQALEQATKLAPAGARKRGAKAKSGTSKAADPGKVTAGKSAEAVLETTDASPTPVSNDVGKTAAPAESTASGTSASTKSVAPAEDSAIAKSELDTKLADYAVPVSPVI